MSTLQTDMSMFQQLNSEEKKQCCLTVLEGVKDRWGLFSELYELVKSGNASEKILSDIYESSLVVLYGSEESRIQQATQKLESSKDQLKKVLEEEQKEREREINEADKTLNF